MADVIVVGAGPAGTVTAALLRRLGYEVQIWDRATFPRHRIGESLPPRAIALLKHLGFRADGFAVMEGHTSIWGDGEARRAVFQEGYGLQVERDRFDQLLVDQASVPVHFGKAVTGTIRDDGRVTGVRFHDGEARARFVVLASGPGKAGRQLRQAATFGYWRNSKHPDGSQANDTIIESFPDGWVWSLRLASDLRNVTVVSDTSGVSYQDAINQTRFVRQMLDGAELASRPIGCDASWQCVPQFAEPGLLLVGDAGSVIDPLSSQGVYKAFSSAMSAAVVINTCLRKPELEAAALDFFNDEERRTYDGYAAGSVATFRAEQRWSDRPFWKTRHALTSWDIQAKPFSADVANAIATGRAMDLVLRNNPHASISKRPTMHGSLIELSDYLVTNTFQYGYRGPHASTIMTIHQALSDPKTIKDLMASVQGTPTLVERRDWEDPKRAPFTSVGYRSVPTQELVHVIVYMYREGLIETV